MEGRKKLTLEVLNNFRENCLNKKDDFSSCYDKYRLLIDSEMASNALLKLLDNEIKEFNNKETDGIVSSFSDFLATRFKTTLDSSPLLTNFPFSKINQIAFQLSCLLEEITGKDRYTFLMPGVQLYYYDENGEKKDLNTLKPWEFILTDDNRKVIPLVATIKLNQDNPSVKKSMYERLDSIQTDKGIIVERVPLIGTENYRFTNHSIEVKKVIDTLNGLDDSADYVDCLKLLEKKMSNGTVNVDAKTYQTAGLLKVTENILKNIHPIEELIHYFTLAEFGDAITNILDDFLNKLIMDQKYKGTETEKKYDNINKLLFDIVSQGNPLKHDGDIHFPEDDKAFRLYIVLLLEFYKHERAKKGDYTNHYGINSFSFSKDDKFSAIEIYKSYILTSSSIHEFEKDLLGLTKNIFNHHKLPTIEKEDEKSSITSYLPFFGPRPNAKRHDVINAMKDGILGYLFAKIEKHAKTLYAREHELKANNSMPPLTGNPSSFGLNPSNK